MCKYALPTSRLSKVSYDRQSDRQTQLKLYMMLLRGWSLIIIITVSIVMCIQMASVVKCLDPSIVLTLVSVS